MVEMWFLVPITALAGFVGGSFMGWLSWWRINAKIASMHGKAISQDGVDGKAEQEAEMVVAMTEALEMHQAGTPIPEIIKNVGLKHPAVAMKFVKMFMSGKLKLPAGLGSLGFN